MFEEIWVEYAGQIKEAKEKSKKTCLENMDQNIILEVKIV